MCKRCMHFVNSGGSFRVPVFKWMVFRVRIGDEASCENPGKNVGWSCRRLKLVATVPGALDILRLKKMLH